MLIATLAASLAFLSPVQSQETPELRGTGWVNARDLSLERLRGKVVVLYFFEEG